MPYNVLVTGPSSDLWRAIAAEARRRKWRVTTIEQLPDGGAVQGGPGNRSGRPWNAVIHTGGPSDDGEADRYVTVLPDDETDIRTAAVAACDRAAPSWSAPLRRLKAMLGTR